MNRRSMLSLLIAASTCTVLRAQASGTAAAMVPSWLGAKHHAPGLGVYLGAGCTGTQRLKVFEQWLGRGVDQTLEFIGWNVLRGGTTWGVKCWRKAGEAVVYSLPMMPPESDATLAQGARGRFDEYFRKYAELLVANGYGASVIRIGWEFNANWYSWRAAKEPQAWADYWRRIVGVMRGVPGAQFQFDWCIAAAARGFDAEKAWPGDDVVDFVGMDFYNMPIDQSPGTPEQRWQARMDMHHGLRWHRDFARRHDKRMSIPEWGSGPHAKFGGAPDDAYFIENMAAWLVENKVAYHNYWDYKNKDLDTRLSNGSQPQAGAAFIRSFGPDAEGTPGARRRVTG